jgi:hypothetical protein
MIKSLPTPPRDKAAVYLMDILAVIDRTILPRQVTFSTDRDEVILAVRSRRAQFLNEDIQAIGFIKRIAAFCNSGGGMSKKIARLENTNILRRGLKISDIVNAQNHEPLEAELLRGADFDFTSGGWPKRMPENASFSSLEIAWQVASGFEEWRRRFDSGLAAPLRFVAISGSKLTRGVTIATGSQSAVSSVELRELGRFFATLSSKIG